MWQTQISYCFCTESTEMGQFGLSHGYKIMMEVGVYLKQEI